MLLRRFGFPHLQAKSDFWQAGFFRTHRVNRTSGNLRHRASTLSSRRDSLHRPHRRRPVPAAARRRRPVPAEARRRSPWGTKISAKEDSKGSRAPGLCRSTVMNCETCHLNELELEPPEIKDVLRCILHTIFFHRTLTLVRPKDVDCDLFEITYVQCGLAELEKEVDEKINQFIAWAEKHPNRRSQVCLSFFDEKNKHPGWFSNKTERIYWEQWFINLHVVSPKGHSKSRGSKAPTNAKGQALEEASSSSRRDALGLLIQEVLFQIINYANEKKDHIPPISDRIFNHEILIPSSSDSVFGWNADVLRRALSSGHSYSLN